MLVKELQSLLIKLKGEKITLADIGKALGTSGANISKRAINNSRLTIEEIVKLENAFNITLVENKKGLLAKVSDSINEHYLKQYNKGYENFMPEESQQIINSDD